MFLAYTFSCHHCFFFFFFNDTATTEIYTLSLHDALPISSLLRVARLCNIEKDRTNHVRRFLTCFENSKPLELLGKLTRLFDLLSQFARAVGGWRKAKSGFKRSDGRFVVTFCKVYFCEQTISRKERRA